MKMIEEKITALHASKTKVCLVCTGAGAGCQNIIAQVPGASNTLLECSFPYSKEALTDFLGEEPKQFVSEETALRMAAKAWRRGVEIVSRQKGDVQDVVGVAITGVIATNRVMRGEHRVYIAARTSKEFFVTSMIFPKKKDGHSVLGRIKEGEISDIVTLDMILHCAGIQPMNVSHPSFKQGGSIVDLHPEKHVLFEGSFNPLHFGHERIAKEVETLTGKKVVYVITNNHPDKGVIGENDIQRRLDQFRWLAPVLATDSLKLYVDKARAYPGFSFIVGADTLRRILDPHYYSVSIEEVLEGFKEHGTSFFVANRRGDEGTITLDSLREKIPLKYRKMFFQLATMIDVSSTALRSCGG